MEADKSFFRRCYKLLVEIHDENVSHVRDSSFLLDNKYVSHLLNNLENNGLIFSNCSHPKIWKAN